MIVKFNIQKGAKFRSSHGMGPDYPRKYKTPVDITTITKASIRRELRSARWRARLLARETGQPFEEIKVAMPCATNRKWIVDSGSCFDIVGVQYMDAKERREQTTTQRPYRITTANGVLRADQETTIPMAKTGSQTTAIVLKDSPCVLSLGKRCMKEGFAFEWKPGENPVLISPDGKRTMLELQNLVPVLPAVAKEPRATEATTTTGDVTTSGTSTPSTATSPGTSSASSSGAAGRSPLLRTGAGGDPSGAGGDPGPAPYRPCCSENREAQAHQEGGNKTLRCWAWREDDRVFPGAERAHRSG